MGLGKLVLALMALQAIAALLPHMAAAGDPLSPLLAPVFNEICNRSVDCGQGTCQASPGDPLGYVCYCNRGWKQSHVEDHLRFLPCIVPNCSINYSCHNESVIPAPSPLPNPTNISFSDPCLYTYCGGGHCVKTTTFEHRCECDKGFSNLLNHSSFPCYSDCSLGVDCASLGITLSNSSAVPSSPPSLSDNGSPSGASNSFAPNTLLWMLTVAISLAAARTDSWSYKHYDM